MQARAHARAWAAPDAAWHHLLLAREAAPGADGRANAIANYRLAADLDPDLVEAWIGLATHAFPSDPKLAMSGLLGAARAIPRSWEAQRRLYAAILPALWLASLLSAAAILLGIGLRHIRPYRHRLEEAFRPRLARGAGWAANLFCLIPLGLQWGFASAAAAYAGVVNVELTRREKLAIVGAVVWFIAQPAVWRGMSGWCEPIASTETAWCIDRAQREVPTPALERIVHDAVANEGSPEDFFARGMVARRSGHLSDALSDFRRAAVDSSAVAAHAGVNLGNLQLWMDDPAGAARQYEKVLDLPQARVEARYNLAIALSRLHRFEEADEKLEEASKLDFDRVRTATRGGDPRATADVMDGALAPVELWSIEHGSAAAHAEAPIPPIAAWLLPGGRPAAALVAVIVSIVLGAIAGRLLRRHLAVHACHQCGAPVCRHCVTRTIGRASCARCAEGSAMLARADYDRILIKRFLGESQDRDDRLRIIATYLVPGIGLVARGRTMSGLTIAWIFAFGAILATRAAWAFPTSPAMVGCETILRVSGLLVALAAWGCSCAVARRILRRRSLRHFFERDAYRVAA